MHRSHSRFREKYRRASSVRFARDFYNEDLATAAMMARKLDKSIASEVQSPTVLHVDDRDENRHLRRRLLESGGFRVVEAASVAEALAAAAQHPPDVVLSDVGLPDGTGFDLTQRLKANP
jgi:phosphoserine phosphatase RsbU/P